MGRFTNTGADHKMLILVTYVRRGDALASFVFPCLWRQAATQYSIFKEEKDMKK